jgi:HEAT repeat protein
MEAGIFSCLPSTRSDGKEVTMDELNTLILNRNLEKVLLKRAISGDNSAVNKILKYLGSADPVLRQRMQDAIKDHGDARIWMKLLRYLALHNWNDQLAHEVLIAPLASKRIENSIEEVFLQDKGSLDRRMKEKTLLNGLDDPTHKVRHVSAYLLGMRGNHHAIPILSETINTGSKESQLCAIQALEIIGDEKCGPPLLEALIMERGEVHREAGRALNRLGKLVESSWLKALNHPNDHIRWHAARGLGNIGDPSYAHILAKGLMDDNRIVRWASADVLAQLGADSVTSTLQILCDARLDVPTLQAAYHALHGISSPEVQIRLKSLLDAMKRPAADVRVPGIAQRLILEWEKVDNDRTN